MIDLGIWLCARRWFNGETSHLINFGKYISMMLATRVKVAYEKEKSIGWLSLVVIMSSIATRASIPGFRLSLTFSTASDGLKSWEVLKENSHNIDLVLTEVELPSISGFSLLTLIMDHETFKNIPVIMMSSHDSISMVFKCMSKGAVDFLVKPIRKNELKNLWQHVWRRHISNGRHSDTQGPQDEDSSKKKSKNCLSEHVASIQEHKESSEKGRDAQSSCTRSDMEAESTYNQNMLDKKHHENSDLSLRDDTVAKNDEEHIQSSSGSLIHNGEAEGATPFAVSCKIFVRSPRRGCGRPHTSSAWH